MIKAFKKLLNGKILSEHILTKHVNSWKSYKSNTFRPPVVNCIYTNWEDYKIFIKELMPYDPNDIGGDYGVIPEIVEHGEVGIIVMGTVELTLNIGPGRILLKEGSTYDGNPYEDDNWVFRPLMTSYVLSMSKIDHFAYAQEMELEDMEDLLAKIRQVNELYPIRIPGGF